MAMSLLYSYDITFKEVPGEVSLTLAFSGCTNTCEGCHSPHLREDVGKKLTPAKMQELLKRYGDHITVVTFLGGESEIKKLAPIINGRGLDICLYTGSDTVKSTNGIRYLKTGAYVASKGGLATVGTNQKMVDLLTGEDITYKYQQ